MGFGCESSGSREKSLSGEKLHVSEGPEMTDPLFEPYAVSGPRFRQTGFVFDQRRSCAMKMLFVAG